MAREATLTRRVIVYAAVFLLLAALCLVPAPSHGLIRPDFLLVLPIVTGLWFSGGDAMWMGLFCGFVLDFAAGRGYGAGALFMMAVGLIAGHLAPSGTRKFFVSLAAMTAIATTAQNFLFAFLSWLIPLAAYERSLSSSMWVALMRLPSALLSNMIAAAVTTVLFYVGFYERKKKEDRRGVRLTFAEGRRADE